MLLPKPDRAARQAAKRRAKRKRDRARAQVQQIVFHRAKGQCERCKRPVRFDVPEWKDERAQVNERVPRSRGGKPLSADAADTELVCRACHFGGPSGAHAPTADRMTRQITRERDE